MSEVDMIILIISSYTIIDTIILSFVFYYRITDVYHEDGTLLNYFENFIKYNNFLGITLVIISPKLIMFICFIVFGLIFNLCKLFFLCVKKLLSIGKIKEYEIRETDGYYSIHTKKGFIFIENKEYRRSYSIEEAYNNILKIKKEKQAEHINNKRRKKYSIKIKNPSKEHLESLKEVGLI